ncbi:hypothetical protein AGMMS50222_07350 [Endomicrobiia bacterium]|nr:hypothetical protein AGMMS49531_04940 [Endomicrobiia bacterium]GHT68259.1 hypothetical protein AGMMS49556_10030 [Endomicrobiia bacterium]GHT75768.1 hypothetical protein AGMMS50222_07350 [Endomicrobiia bacterium]
MFLTSSKFFTQSKKTKKTEKTVLITLPTEKGEKRDLILVKGKAFEKGEKEEY